MKNEYRKKILFKNYIDVIVCMLMIISFLEKIGGKYLSWYIPYLCGFIIITISFFLKKEDEIFANTAKRIVFYWYSFFIVMTAYSFLILLFKNNEIDFFTREFSIFIQMSIIYITVYALFKVFGSRTLSIIIFSMLVASIITIVIGVIVYGIVPTLLYLSNPLADEYGRGASIFELHSMSFSMGFVLFYYLIINKQERKLKKTALVVSIIVIYLAFKKSELIAVPIVFIVYKIIKKFDFKSTKIIIIINGFILTIFSFIYLYMIKYQILDKFVQRLNVNTSGRTLLYDIIMRVTPLRLDYMGIGYKLVSKELFPLLSDYAYLGYTSEISLHSDVLDMYIGMGFIGFFIWNIYLFLILPYLVQRRSNAFSGKVTVLMTIYAYIVYLTDNTSTYFIFQIMMMAIIIECCAKGEIECQTLK